MNKDYKLDEFETETLNKLTKLTNKLMIHIKTRKDDISQLQSNPIIETIQKNYNNIIELIDSIKLDKVFKSKNNKKNNK